jgi:hypothetical protein
MSVEQARAQHSSTRANARNQPWELASDFDVVLSQVLAQDGDSAREFRARAKSGEPVGDVQSTVLEVIEILWSGIYPGRHLEWKDWAPIVRNDIGGTQYNGSQMSDGERAALYLLAKVLLIEEGSILVIDEPETHFHSLLAIRLWDALEASRPDLRFVYVTHDLVFSLSREPTTYLLSDPIVGLTVLDLKSDLPADVRRELLGAASFSYYASRVVFCEGEAHSLDRQLLTAWFKSRDTVVVPVGSCDAVRECVRAFRTGLVSGVQPIGIIDRDFRPNAFFDALDDDVVALPVHEVEGLLCLPAVRDPVAAHLGQPAADRTTALVESISDVDIRRVALERTKLLLLNGSENVVNSKPASWSELDLQAHVGLIGQNLRSLPDPAVVFSEELARARTVIESRDPARILETFPAKPILARVSSELGTNAQALKTLVCAALETEDAASPLFTLGQQLEQVFKSIGLPDREVGDRAR